jgi:hypothetical protein
MSARSLVALAAVATCIVAASPSAAEPAYIPPVSPSVSTIVDHFRPPPTPYSAGNRGIDYATVPGSIVVASAAGVVVFAGEVAGALHVTIRHADGLRTSYSFLARLLVAAGQEVAQGQPIGVTGSTFHFGVRDPAGDYLDPEALLRGTLGAHLVPGPGEPGAQPPERDALAAVVADAAAGRPARAPAASSRPHLGTEALGLWRLAIAVAALPRLDRLASMGAAP